METSPSMSDCQSSPLVVVVLFWMFINKSRSTSQSETRCCEFPGKRRVQPQILVAIRSAYDGCFAVASNLPKSWSNFQDHLRE